VSGMRSRIQAAGAGLILAFAVGCVVAGPVAAQDRGHDERGRGGEARGHDDARGHERRDVRDHQRRGPERGYGYDAPPEPSPEISLFFNFR
jgi:hypothetical protein